MEENKLVWNDNLSVGLELADRQHRKFSEIIEDLGVFIRSNQDASLGSTFFFRLIHFADDYLLKEKMLVNEVESIDYSYFREKHLDFLRELTRYQKAFEQGNKIQVLESLYAYLNMIFPQFIGYYTPSLVQLLKQKGIL